MTSSVLDLYSYTSLVYCVWCWIDSPPFARRGSSASCFQLGQRRTHSA